VDPIVNEVTKDRKESFDCPATGLLEPFFVFANKLKFLLGGSGMPTAMMRYPKFMFPDEETEVKVMD
jgi:hypothetical protein